MDLSKNYYLPPPPSSSKTYDFWAIKMRTRIHTEELGDIVLNGFEEPSNHETYETMIQNKKDATTLSFIKQGLDESILPKITAATKSKEDWDNLEMA